MHVREKAILEELDKITEEIGRMMLSIVNIRMQAKFLSMESAALVEDVICPERYPLGKCDTCNNPKYQCTCDHGNHGDG